MKNKILSLIIVFILIIAFSIFPYISKNYLLYVFTFLKYIDIINT